MVNPNLDLKSLTMPDSRRCTVLGRRQSRLDATLGYQNVAYDVDRVQLTYATRYVVITYPFVIFVKLYYSNCRFLLLYMSSKALRSLQNASGIYGMAVASAAVEFPDEIVGHFVGGKHCEQFNQNQMAKYESKERHYGRRAVARMSYHNRKNE